MAVTKKKVIKKSKKDITLDNYKLSENDSFMCKEQLSYFRLKLEKWRCVKSQPKNWDWSMQLKLKPHNYGKTRINNT